MRLAPRPNMPRRLAYADRWVWELTQTVDDYSCNTRLSESDETKLFSALLTGADLAYPDQSHRLMLIMWQLLDCQIREQTPAEVIREVVRYVCTTHPDVVEQEMDNMLKIEIIGGQPFLEQDCGCGQRKYYALSEAAVNPVTGAPGSVIDSPPTYIEEVPLTPGANVDCYADKAADIYINALTAYTDAVFDYALLGAAAFAPVATTALLGAVEIQQAIVAALNGNLGLDFSDVGYTANEVKTAFRDQPFRDFIKARLGDDQRVSRWVLELVQVRLNANFALNTPTPLAPVFGAWAKTANIEALNLALQQAALECETGNSVPAPYVRETDGVYDFWVFETGNLNANDGYPLALPPELENWNDALALIANRTRVNDPGGAGIGTAILREAGITTVSGDIRDDFFDLGNATAAAAARTAGVIPAPTGPVRTTGGFWVTGADTTSPDVEFGAFPSNLSSAYVNSWEFAIVTLAT